MKGISTYVALTIVVMVTLAIGSLVYFWWYGFVQQTSQQYQEIGESSLRCEWGGLIVYTDTISCSSGFLNFSIKNEGYINLYNIRVEVFDGNKIYVLDAYDRYTNKPITKENPLTPLNVSNLYVNVSNINVKWFKVITQCKNINSGEIEILC